ncbi:hypothetical protein ABZY42_18155 [Streptomyces sp. NPDC006622]|uniref:hypothetical protein n=1 Tax=Streptomyces sp. NPDC006622 TaxID=3155459 RepID=UPI0033A8A3A8
MDHIGNLVGRSHVAVAVHLRAFAVDADVPELSGQGPTHLIDLPTVEVPRDPVFVALDNLARIVQDNVSAEMVVPTDPVIADAFTPGTSARPAADPLGTTPPNSSGCCRPLMPNCRTRSACSR